MFKSSIGMIVARVIQGLNIANPSEMTNEQLNQLITDSIYQSITSEDYIREIDERLGKRMEMRKRGMAT